MSAAVRGIPSLDGLRALSISLVVLYHGVHTVDAPNAPWLRFIDYIDSGSVGVRIFFVISGFLITNLLLAEAHRDGRIHLGRFYFRRTLRIFPPYYVYILVVVLLSAAGIIEVEGRSVVHALTYTSNYVQSGWFFGHTWSLSVEEQFYLLWPAVLILAGVRRGAWIAAGVIIAVPLIRVVEFHVWQDVWARHMAYHHFEFTADALAAGCLLAFVRRDLGRSAHYRAFQESPAFLLVPIGVIAALLTADHPHVQFLVGMTAANLGIALCIDWCVTNPGGRVGRVLNAGAVKLVGRMSYSIYLWQQLFIVPSGYYSGRPLRIAAALAAAAVSYYAVERTALALRQRWEPRLFHSR